MTKNKGPIVDVVTSKSIYIDGKKVSGVLGFDLGMNIDKESLLTEVTLRLAVRRGSLSIKNVGRRGAQKVSFSTVNEAFK